VDVRLALESEVLSWPHITTRFMFGCLAYLARGKLFAFIQDESVVLTSIGEVSRAAVTESFEAFAFESKGKPVGSWIEVVISDEAELGELMPYVRESYENSLAKALED
jgi:TfoX/Sxy family transcriptional regulator of competence genes